MDNPNVVAIWRNRIYKAVSVLGCTGASGVGCAGLQRVDVDPTQCAGVYVYGGRGARGQFISAVVGCARGRECPSAAWCYYQAVPRCAGRGVQALRNRLAV